MQKLRIKLALAALSAAIALVIAWRLFPGRVPNPIDFQVAPGGPSDVAEEETFGWPTVAATPLEALPGLLEVELPRHPPSTFQRRPLTSEEVWRHFGNDGRCVYDPFALFRRKPGVRTRHSWPEHPNGRWTMRTNSAGFRNDAELLAQPDLRVLVTGDSHADGVCDNAESFCALAENWLAQRRPGEAVEVLNSATGGYSFYNYLGVLERSLPLRPDVFVVAVYGGNDFEEALTLYHLFNGTKRPAGQQIYTEEVRSGVAAFAPLIAQAFISYKYFVTHPDQMEVALQMARDVLTEIQVTCLRNGIELAVVYVPPVTDVQRESFAKEVAAVSAAMGLSLEDLWTTDRMADALTAFLRQRRIPLLDLRAPFREAEERLYWATDCHVNLAGHRRIAELLAPLLDELAPRRSQRVRPAPDASIFRRPRARAALESPGSVRSSPAERWTDEGERVRAQGPDSLGRRTTTEEQVRGLFRLLPTQQYDPRAFFRLASELEERIPLAEHPRGGYVLRTNAAGLRRGEELGVDRPDLRVLVTGGADVEGACDEEETFCAVAERELRRLFPERRIEVLNAGCSGYGFYNFPGVIERFESLRPDVLVVSVDSADDFFGVLRPWYHFRGGTFQRPREDEKWPVLLDPARVPPELAARILKPLRYFRARPAEADVSLRAAMEALLLLRDRCRELGTRLIVLAQPAPHDLDGASLRPRLEPLLGELELGGGHVDLLARMHERFLAELARHRMTAHDLGSILALHPGPHFRPSDLRLDLRSHALIGHWLAGELATHQKLAAVEAPATPDEH